MNSVKEFYRDAQKDWDRLDLLMCQIEFASTLALIDEQLENCGTIADIGGGPGRYTLELLRRGHRVTLFDLSAQNIALAKTMI
jgi:S-adenosylmethionine-dependent methyltransferase